jgi:hypothetical protein
MLDLNENASRFKLSCVADHQFAIFNLICWCGSMAEQLIRNEQVVSSILTTSSKNKVNHYLEKRPKPLIQLAFKLLSGVCFFHQITGNYSQILTPASLNKCQIGKVRIKSVKKVSGKIL